MYTDVKHKVNMYSKSDVVGAAKYIHIYFMFDISIHVAALKIRDKFIYKIVV
jgi:hypothetical protein